MARRRRPDPTPPNGFVASAVSLPAPTRRLGGVTQGWQAEAWRMYDQVGELRYLANWIGNSMSRAVLHAAKRTGNQLVPQDSGPARESMDALYGGPQGQGQMLQLLGVDTTVAGEGYITARVKNDTDQWNVVTTGKVAQKNEVVTVNFGEGEGLYTMGKEDLIIRVWTPHPTESAQADAPTRSNLRTLRQIVSYDDHIAAQIQSRLLGAGILPLPSEIEFAIPPDADPADSKASHFMRTLYDAMEAAREDLSSPAAKVPIVVTVPGEYMEYLPEKPITFWNELDDSVVEMRLAAIKRFAIGMDAPPEVLTGNEDANHWNAWLSDEHSIKAHLEPRLAVVNHALTHVYLRPSLKGVVPDAELADYFVIADTAPLRVRPDRSTDARELRELGLLNAEATLREAGFNPEDLMEGDEFQRWLLVRIATGAVTPELTAAALQYLGTPITVQDVVGDDPQGQPRSNMAPPSNDADDREIPEQPALAAACDVLVYRALELAGNRLRAEHKVPPADKSPRHTVYLTLNGVDADALLKGAWDCAPAVLEKFDVDTGWVVDTLDFYVRGLLSAQREHSTHTLGRLLDSWGTEGAPPEALIPG